MPYQVTTESNARGVIISLSGVVSGTELLALNGRLTSEESFSQCRYQIWDFSKATLLDVTIEQLRSLSMQDAEASAENPNVKIAIVGQQAFFSGKDRIFQIFEDVWTTYKSKVFLDVETAREWASDERT